MGQNTEELAGIVLGLIKIGFWSFITLMGFAILFTIIGLFT